MIDAIKSLFKSGDLLKAGIDGVDASFFTEEEKRTNWHRLLELYEPFKIAQRLLAAIYALPYALAWSWTFIATALGTESEGLIQLLSGDMGVINGIIVAFYFGGGAVEGVIKRKADADVQKARG